MPNSYLDIFVEAKAYPYVTPKAALTGITGAGSGTGTGSGGTGTGGGGTGIGSGGAGITEQLSWKELSVSFPDISTITGGIEKVTKALDKIIKVLEPVLKLVELYINLSSSFTKILASLFDLLTSKVEDYTKDLANKGVYLNIIVPPALLKDSLADVNLAQLSSGGFQGFLSRLQTSLGDPNDKQRPVFGSEGVVGGFIILVDSENLDSFFSAMFQLAAVFDFMKLFGLNLSPPPPTNLRGRVGYFSAPDGTQKYGVQLDWDPPPSFALRYMITRSKVHGGEKKVVDYVPTSLVGKDGLIQVVKNSIALRQWDWPEKTITVYEDPDFNKGKPVVMLPTKADGGGRYVDFIEPPLVEYKQDTYAGKTNSIAMPTAKTPKELFYVVQSVAALGFASVPPENLARGLVPGVGPKSQEIAVPLKFCDDSAEVASVIQHNTGHNTGAFEFLAPGWGKFGNWTQLQIKAIIPYVPELAGMLIKFLNQLKGMMTDASDSFTEFIKQLKEKIQNYIGLVKVISRFLQELKKFVIGQSVAFLWVPPKTGGTAGFMKRVRAAKVPPGGFSGPSGISAGIVFMFGAEANQAEIQVLEKAFELIKKFLGGQ